MKIKNVAIKNFRGYSDEINSDFEDLTAFVGKNDLVALTTPLVKRMILTTKFYHTMIQEVMYQHSLR